MYDPSLQKVEVLRLEKRLDDELFYLRDALPEYSTFDLNMEPEIIPEGNWLLLIFFIYVCFAKKINVSNL